MSSTPRRLTLERIHELIARHSSGTFESTPTEREPVFGFPEVIVKHVFIAGSGPIGCTYARSIHDQLPKATIFMAEVGSQDDPVVGAHHKNSIKYQKDIDTFVNVIKGALQPVSTPPEDTYIPTIGGQGWTPPVTGDHQLVIHSSNPNQIPGVNLPAAAMTRTVGGMATHWTCACPLPDAEERVNNPINPEEFERLLATSRQLFNVHDDQYNHSIRHQFVRQALLDALPKSRGVGNLPLAVERRKENPLYVTWTGSNTVLGDTVKSSEFYLSPETKVVKLVPFLNQVTKINDVACVLIRNLRTNQDSIVIAKAFIIACGAIGTPQVLVNSCITTEQLPALGHYLCEQSLSFCQIVMKTTMIDAIENSKDPEVARKVKLHHQSFPMDPLPIPFSDPEPQVIIPYTHDYPHHVQVHRDAFSYGDVGPRADSRVVVDLRFFGKQDSLFENKVEFSGAVNKKSKFNDWIPGVTDIYGMPQATFVVQRSPDDKARDQAMMEDMTSVANILGSYLPGSEPQFMAPGLALHITGTTRIGEDKATSVANAESKVHGFNNLWVGGNGCIPDSTACNPTVTSAAIALKGAGAVVAHLKAGNIGV